MTDIDLSSPATFLHGIPYEDFARRRATAPVSWVEETPLVRHAPSRPEVEVRGTGFWALTSHSSVTFASRRTDLFSSKERGAFLADPLSRAELERQRQLLVNMDAPEHARLRRYVSAAFTPRAVARLNDAVAHHASSLVTAARARGDVDLVTELAAALPLRVLADLLGVPQGDLPLLLMWSNHMVGFDDPEYGGGDVRQYHQTLIAALAYARAHAIERRASPGEDLYSQLAAAELGGSKLTEDELANLWLLLVIGGNESTRHMLSGAIVALLEHPEQLARLRANDALLAPAVEELLRWVSPVMQFRRTAVADVELEGRMIRRGDKVVLYYVSANRDEAVFSNANELDLGRTPNPHVAFGIGPHFCLGAHLARLEVTALLRALLPIFESVELTSPPVRLSSNFMNGIKALPARIRP